jgi:hypothetical protein
MTEDEVSEVEVDSDYEALCAEQTSGGLWPTSRNLWPTSRGLWPTGRDL